ncbi:MAG: malate dehydrogenase (oxaloacetate-decarboxylating)(NADP+) [Myxococcota bacterium]|jgi:malate dehydrogenase (oxaloacetate-decarboxylating)(NADP+)
MGDTTIYDGLLALDLGSEVVAPEGALIMEEGAAATAFYMLLEGTVAIEQAGQSIVTIGAGEVLGEMALFHKGLRTSSVRATEDCRLWRVPIDRFVHLVLHQDLTATHVMEALGAQMVERVLERDRTILRRLEADDPTFGANARALVAQKRRMLNDWALQYHAIGRPGKLAIETTKPCGTAAELSVAYSPGVAEPCLAIAVDPDKSYDYTTRGNLVGVVTNGTAVLGLGNIGPLAAKPVMEGKAVLFKRFADVDAFDIEVDETDPERFIQVVAAISPTFGGINLEDIRAPECFEIERRLQDRLDIPVFHDDQHGTAIIAGAALLNALKLTGKRIEDIRVVFSGAGAAGFATARFAVSLGVRRENLTLTDIKGVVRTDRPELGYLAELASDGPHHTLAEAINGADVFVGVSAGGVLKPAMLATMAADPVVFALANPTPEIEPGLARETRSDVIMATGRSDFPNQVNNVIAFPYIFRGALDVRASRINEAMKHAATRAIAALAQEPCPPSVGTYEFGREYLIPKPFDPRLRQRLCLAVAQAAVDSGVARIELDLERYTKRLA